ncbi:conserved Plasmodium protein, unknown function [Plasmodium knowlesi strain H]|uniref:Uncharacterized protein n=3 Tax=Plasmodium knowlesi TaxID=5850 RepID=A0A5K1UNQ3_PLAKH|nr:conserved Plasmodium protein, unknown function [Plasmodium knowlesi strain H]OTN65516.1 Uncharacterized protein PKNOH_S110081900 [Plasmodium knowlesi]CAA9989441.1 conserved Plasmodium protein, unknown function [Plasmodium knowlesi strain H]SBO25070.1 conserved Plasmodium protein, unknown function [Plasmodium knowlesi strain H]SBO27832.1 conserved Plasmodium protein, unknown function [Plasmodium knowlesi strain H]VVS78915.1 conserved Plasmodium protein, unknown function [Plasmodium knowlesi |eukprot:XP_002260167.1 hypothetical protein, conserved in Plasmodium species [Plasmodium knowlesi strain H]
MLQFDIPTWKENYHRENYPDYHSALSRRPPDGRHSSSKHIKPRILSSILSCSCPCNYCTYVHFRVAPPYEHTMMQAEYYPKQNIVSLNIEFSSWAKAFLTDLRTSKNLLSCTKASIIIKKKKEIRNFYLYKIKLRLLYDNSSKRPGVSVEGEKLKQKNSPLDDFTDGNNTPSDSPLPRRKSSLYNAYTNVEGGNKRSVIYNEEKEVKASSGKATSSARNDGKCLVNGVEWEGFNGRTHSPLYTKQEDEAKSGTEYTPMNVGHRRGYHSSEINNHTMENIQQRSEKNFRDNHFDTDHLLRKKNIFSKDFPIFERAHLAKYLFLPSALPVQSAKIKSIHFVLNERLNICILLDLIIGRKKNNIVQSSINKELHDMLRMQKSTLQCKSCNEDVIICGDVNFILPNLYLKTADFLEHAFCEECTTFSFDGLKNVDRNIFLFPNCLFFHFSLVKESHLAVKANSLDHFRCLIFCNFCYNTLGYLENQRNHTYSCHKNKNMSDKLQDVFLGSLHEVHRGMYTQLDNTTMLMRPGDLPYIQSKADRANLIHHLDVAPMEKKQAVEETNDVLLSEENFHGERKHTEKKDTPKNSNEGLRLDHSGGNLNPCGEITPKLYLLKHKIKMTLNGGNIFKNYNHVLFLNEYMHYKCEKKNTTLFYLRSNQKRKIIEVRIFIRTLYISKILDKVKDLSNFLGVQKVMKIFFCIKEESKLKLPNSETIELSRELYEDILKMLVAYSFRGCAPGAKLCSYLHLVH